MPQIEFEKCSEGLLWTENLDICVGDKRLLRINGTGEVIPADESRAGKRNGPVFHRAVDFIDTELVIERETDGHQLIFPNPRTPARQLHEIGTQRREGIKSFRGACRTDEETLEESSLCECEKPSIDPRD